MSIRKWSICTIIACMVGTAAVADDEINDPFEPVNRAVFEFNEYADSYVLSPLNDAYDYVVPDPGKKAVSNVLQNLQMPVTFLNSVLQADAENAFSSLWSFLLNSTFGFGGIYDFVDEHTDIKVRNEDFGQTLGSWGVGEGPYVVLPLFGPSNVRDTAGFVVDQVTDPYSYVDKEEFVLTRVILTILDARYRNDKFLEDIYESSFDPYATFRSVYTQYRRASVANSN